jgi:hypothetical protein
MTKGKFKTVGFFGDSFCASKEDQSWCVILSKKLGANITHWGQEGRSIWTVFFEIENMIRNKQNFPDVSIFCWTEPYRLYHPSLILSANTQPPPHADPNIYKTLEQYWKHLHNYEKDELSYRYSLSYFDSQVLPMIKSEVVQMWSFKPFETAGKDGNMILTTGRFLDESMYAFSKLGLSKDSKHYNHMSEQQNVDWANKVFERLIKDE